MATQTHNIVVFPGDHCGPEVIFEGVKVLRSIEANSKHTIAFQLHYHLLGGCSIDSHGTPLTDTALAAAKAADAVLLGAIGGPEGGTGEVRPEQGLLQLRKELGAYGNLRPCWLMSDSLEQASPLKADVCRGVDIMMVRELTGGIYFGPRQEATAGTDADADADTVAWDTELYSRREIERVARLAGLLATKRGRDCRVISLDKANVLASSRLWRTTVTALFEREFPAIQLEHQLIDSAALMLMKKPRALNGVWLTANLFGDIISDQASAIPGSIGLLPSASINALPDGTAKCSGIYEPIHGSAPDISGKGIANPIGTILSVAMMLRYSLRLPRHADAVDQAVKAALDAGLRTHDLGGAATTTQAGDAVVEQLEHILRAWPAAAAAPN